MCQTLTTRVLEHLAALRDALHDHVAPRLREVAHKSCGMLSDFSSRAGDLAGSLEELAAGAHLDQATVILQQLETVTHEVVEQMDGLTADAPRCQIENRDET